MASLFIHSIPPRICPHIKNILKRLSLNSLNFLEIKLYGIIFNQSQIPPILHIVFTGCTTNVNTQILSDDSRNKSLSTICLLTIETHYNIYTRQPLDQATIECQLLICDLILSKMLIGPLVDHLTRSSKLQPYTFNLLDYQIKFSIKPQPLIYSSPTETRKITLTLNNNLMMQGSNLDHRYSSPNIETIGPLGH